MVNKKEITLALALTGYSLSVFADTAALNDAAMKLCDKSKMCIGKEMSASDEFPPEMKAMMSNMIDEICGQYMSIANLGDEHELIKHSFVKCSVINSQILYCFRKSPSHNNFETQKKYIRKILGLLAFKKEFLITITKNKAGGIEQFESIEQLRIIENNYPLTSIYFEKTQASINEPEDIEIVLNVLKNDNEQKGLLNQVLTF